MKKERNQIFPNTAGKKESCLQDFPPGLGPLGDICLSNPAGSCPVGLFNRGGFHFEQKKRQRGCLCLLLTLQIELASAAIAASAAEKQEDNDDPAGIAVSASVVASEAVVSAGTQKNNDPENTAAGTISERRKAIATPATAVTSTAIIASTSRSVVTASTIGSS